MTLSTSAVAVCCCSDSRSSLSSRAFSIAITACAAKFFTSSICLSVKGRTSLRIDHDHTDCLTLLKHRHSDQRPDTANIGRSHSQRITSELFLQACPGCGRPSRDRMARTSECRLRGGAAFRCATARHKPVADRRASTFRYPSPSTSHIAPKLASHSSTPFASIVSNTGRNSPAELLITFSTSAVAVCC